MNNNTNAKLHIRIKLTAKSVDGTGKITVGIKHNHLPFLPIVPYKEKQCITITHCQYQQFHLTIHLSLTDICFEGNVKGWRELCPLALF